MRWVQWVRGWRHGKQGEAPGAPLLAFALIAVVFVLFRWVTRREPWNSDDMTLFQMVQGAAEGKHWLLGTNPEGVGPLGQAQHILHPAFRVGLLPVGVPAVWLLGPTAAAYYGVPLAFEVLGFCALFWLAWRCFGPTVALCMSIVHVAWPFELEHASVFLTDLPAAAVSLVCLCSLDASTRTSTRGRALCIVVAGMAAWETYLLRNNGLVLLSPALLVMLWNRATRRQTIWVIAIAAAGVLCQQLLLVWRGFGWGYDWLSVRRDFAEHAPFLPVYSWPAFLVRQLTYQLYTFGHGVAGWLAALLMLCSLGLHVLALRFERRPLPLALAIFGLSSWLVFTYSIYERVPGGVRATVPVNYRFIQPFAYSSLVAWAGAVSWLHRRIVGQGAGWFRPSLARWALGATAAGIGLCSVSALIVRTPETYRASETRRLVDALDAALARAPREPVTVIGLAGSIRVPRTFCSATRRVDWREATVQDLAAAVSQREPVFVLRDVPRELSYARYLSPEEQRAYREQLAQLDADLWREADLAYIDATYALYAPPGAPGTSVATGAEPAQFVPASFVPGKSETACLVEPDPGGNAVRLVPPGSLRRGTWCELEWPMDARVLPEPAPGKMPDRGIVLRVRVEYELPVSVMLDVVERSEHGTERRSLRLSSGTSYVPLSAASRGRSVSLEYRVWQDGMGGAGARVYPVQARELRY